MGGRTGKSGMTRIDGMSAVTPATVAERLVAVRDRIQRAGGSTGAVTVVAVTKGLGPEAVDAAVGAGLTDIGENYAQEMLSKLRGAPAQARWHFLGPPQRNKLARLAPHVRLWHGLDSEEHALALSQRQPGAAVLVQVRTAGPPGRHGVSPPCVPALVASAQAAGLDVRGLMAVGPNPATAAEARQCFREVARLAAGLGLRELSMGMSADFDLAVAEGATIVRLGTALFGPRPRVVGVVTDEAKLGCY
jgi:pyridoxal phosphate enzyme (YggS family)